MNPFTIARPRLHHRSAPSVDYLRGPMRTVGTALVLATLLAAIPGRPVQPQIGGFIKKKAVEAAKGKKEEGELTSSWATDSCGAITPEKIKDLLRGLQAEAAARAEFDAAASKAESIREETQAKVKACRDGENGGPAFLQIMTDGFSGPNPPSTAEAVMAQQAKNKVKWDEYLDKKCGKEPAAASTLNPREAYKRAHATGAKTAGMSEYCYDVLSDAVIAFCNLSAGEQKAAVENGLRAGNTKKWLFTKDEAKAIQPYCSDLLTALGKIANRG